jgi:hypothetical protein
VLLSVPLHSWRELAVTMMDRLVVDVGDDTRELPLREGERAITWLPVELEILVREVVDEVRGRSFDYFEEISDGKIGGQATCKVDVVRHAIQSVDLNLKVIALVPDIGIKMSL